MRMLNILGSVVLLSLLSAKPSDGQQITTDPVNTAALSGTEAQLNCSATLGSDFLTWSYLDDTAYVRIYQTPNNDVIAGFQNNFSVVYSPPEFNLIIKEANAYVARTYQCELLLNGASKRANLVAVEEVQCPQPSIEVVEGQELLLPGNVVYHSPVQQSLLTPVLTWSNNQNLSTSEQTTSSNSSYVETVLNVTLDATNDGIEFACDLSFEGTGAPDYTASCFTTVYVLHGVSEISIGLTNFTDGMDLDVGTIITCVTNGRPAPIIQWIQDNSTLVASDNENLTVTEDMVGLGPLTYICQANNTVENTTYGVELSVTFVAVDVNQQPVSTHGVETWVIVVSVVVPVVVLTAAGVAAFFIFRHHQKKKKSKKPKTNGSSATAATASIAAVEPVESQPFLYTPNQQQQPSALPRSVGNGVSYQPNGTHGSTSGFADIGGQGAPVAGAGTSLAGSQYGGSTSRVATPNQMTYPYGGPPAANGVAAGPGPAPVVGGRGTPAITAGPQLAAYAGSTGRLTPATDVSHRTNPVAYPYAGPTRQMSNASSTSSYGGSQQNARQPPPLSYPPARPGSSHNSSLV